jgi:hypothetical protein
MIRGNRPLTNRRPTTPAESEPDLVWEALSQIGAVLIRTAKGGSIWLALDQGTADEIRAEEQQREEPCPVLTLEDPARPLTSSEVAKRRAGAR